MNQHRMSADGELRLISVHLPVPNSPLKEGHVCMYVCMSSSPRISDPQLYENSTDPRRRRDFFYSFMVFYVIFSFC